MPWFNKLWGVADEALLEVDVDDEERYMWHTFLDRGDFSNAFRHCRNQVCSISHAPCMFTDEDSRSELNQIHDGHGTLRSDEYLIARWCHQWCSLHLTQQRPIEKSISLSLRCEKEDLVLQYEPHSPALCPPACQADSTDVFASPEAP